MKYCESISQTKRWKTRAISIGDVKVGGDNPVRIQSMTTSSTSDVEATAEQIIRLADAGCEIARVTVQGMKEADACEGIKNYLLQKGYTIPLVADIHFFPPAAMRVVESVDKVRINPGNYVDKRASFKVIEYDDITYAKEIERIEEKFTPLVEKAKKLKRSMRIGTNHGSLSDRIMNRFGDTPKGMVESALEFARVCRKNDYHEFLFSMKSSNPIVMIYAYRLLVAEMMKLGWDYPLHLGVTEAGEGEDGRIKSAIGIGSLLLDGLGDTIRVSLTEDPWYEIDPCQRLIRFAKEYEEKKEGRPFFEEHRLIDQIKKREVHLPQDVSMHRDGTVALNINETLLRAPNMYKEIGCDLQMQRPKVAKTSGDLLIVPPVRDEAQEKKLADLKECGISSFSLVPSKNAFSLVPLAGAKKKSDPYALFVRDEDPKEWEKIVEAAPSLIFLGPQENRVHACRHFFEWMAKKELKIPVIFAFDYTCSKEDMVIQAATECGALLADGLGDGLCLNGASDSLRTLSFNILQAARRRSFKTDFISCPSCGRTLFNLQEVTKRIHSRTSHLAGVKIAIMGCIVNGPGEMADADFGYVGSKPGKIDLYVGKERVEKDIDTKDAVDRLIALIKQHGRWVEPTELVSFFS